MCVIACFFRLLYYILAKTESVALFAGDWSGSCAGVFRGNSKYFFSSGATFMLGSAGGCVGFDTGAVCLSAVSSGTFRDCRRVW